MGDFNRFHCIVFDLDGTVFDTLPSLAGAANHVLRRHGLSVVAAAQLRRVLSHGPRALFREALRLQPVPVDGRWRVELEEQFVTAYEDGWLAEATVYPGAASAIGLMRERGWRLGVCCNRQSASARGLLASARLEPFFDKIVGAGDTARPKPAADPLREVLSQLGVAANEAILVGDSEVDARCASACGVAFAAHTRGYAETPADLLPRLYAYERYDALNAWARLLLAPAARRRTC